MKSAVVTVVKKCQLLPLEVLAVAQLWKEDTQKTKLNQMVSVLKTAPKISDILMQYVDDDSIFEGTTQIKLTTFRKVEESIIEEHDIGIEEKQPIKDNYNIEEEEEENKSITEGDVVEDDKPTTEKAVEVEKKPVTEEEKKSTVEEANTTGAMARNGAAATTKPTPLPHTIK